MKKFLRILNVCVLVVCMTVIPALGFDTLEENFQGAYAGDTLELLEEMYYYFEGIYATPDSHTEIIEDEAGKYMAITGYVDLRSLDYYTGEYVFSADLMMGDVGQNMGFFVRGERPGALTKVNEPNAGSVNVFNYYEWDWYAENGGQGGSTIGGSGIGVLPNDGFVKLLIKKYAEDGLTVATDFYEIETPDEYNADSFNNYKVTDDGNEVKLYVCGKLLATVRLSSDSVSYESDGTDAVYFKSATVFDASGSELGTTENTRINFSGSQIAMTTRSTTLYLDNLSVAYGEGAISADGGPAFPVTTGTPAPATTQAQQGGETNPGTTDGSVTADGAGSETSEETKAPGGGMSKKTLIVVIIAAVVVVAVVVIVAVALPKKKSK